VKVTVDNQDYGDAGQNGVDIANLPPGNHEVVLTEGNTSRKLSLTNGAAPTIEVRLDSDRIVGSVLILTPGVEDVQVDVDGKPYKLKHKTKNGRFSIPNLPVKQHTIRVHKDGFQEEQPQTVEIKKGEEAKLEFHFRLSPTVAVLTINGAAAGAQVKLDQRPAGTIGADGNLSVPDISPGNHTIEIAGYKAIAKNFSAGQTVTVVQSELIPQVTKLTVKLVVTPSNATVTYKGADGRTHEAHTPLELEEGQYTFTATAPSRSQESVTVAIGAGKPNLVTLNLPQSNVPVKAATVTMETWAPQSGWKLENGWYVHRGGGLVLYPVQPSAGTFVFTAHRQGAVFGNKRIEWVVGCLDNTSDYIRFGIDKKSIHRAPVTGGKKQKEEQVPLKSQAKELEFTLRIEISASGVTTYVQGEGGAWEKIDSWPASGLNPANGKFGFYLPGTDEVYISNFSFTPKP